MCRSKVSTLYTFPSCACLIDPYISHTKFRAKHTGINRILCMWVFSLRVLSHSDILAISTQQIGACLNPYAKTSKGPTVTCVLHNLCGMRADPCRGLRKSLQGRSRLIYMQMTSDIAQLTGEFADSTHEPQAESAKFVSLWLLLNLRDARLTRRELYCFTLLYIEVGIFVMKNCDLNCTL